MQIEKELLERILLNIDKLRRGGVCAVENNCDSEENSNGFLSAITAAAEEIMRPFNERMEERQFRRKFAEGEAEEEAYGEWINHLIGCFALLGISETISLISKQKACGKLEDIIFHRPGWSIERAEFWLEQNQKLIQDRLTKAFQNIVGEILTEQKR